MAERKCSICQHEVSPDDLYCSNCGTIFGFLLQCMNHHFTAAQGVCIICGKPICKKCVTRQGFRFLCQEDARYEIEGEFACVFTDESKHEAENISNILREARVDNFVSPPASNGLSTVKQPEGWYKVYVPIKLVTKCESIIQQGGTTFRFECSNCGAQFNTEESKCPNCGEEFFTDRPRRNGLI